MKKSALFYDFELELTKPDGSRETHEFGYSPSHEEVLARAKQIYPDCTAKVLRTVREHTPTDTPICELTVAWERVEKPAGQRFVLRDRQGREAASEFDGGHMQTAFEFLTKSKPEAKWKTLEMLQTLRQAIREDRVNGRDVELDELLAGDPARARVSGYLFGARARDRVHHGSQTF